MLPNSQTWRKGWRSSQGYKAWLRILDMGPMIRLYVVRADLGQTTESVSKQILKHHKEELSTSSQLSRGDFCLKRSVTHGSCQSPDEEEELTRGFFS
jgi:hypothetical protein